MRERSEYELARDRALAKQEAARIERQLHGRARRVLAEAGWNADGGEIALAAAADDLIPDDQLGRVWLRAIEMQGDERYTGRRIVPRQEAEVGRPSLIPAEKRERIVRDAAADMRKDRSLSGNAVRMRMNARHDVSISEANWWKTYAPKVREQLASKASTNGKHEDEETAAPPKVLEPREPADDFTVDDHCEECGEFENECTCEEEDVELEQEDDEAGDEDLEDEELEEPADPPVLLVEPLSPGRFRVTVTYDGDLAAVMHIASLAADEIATLAGSRGRVPANDTED